MAQGEVLGGMVNEFSGNQVHLLVLAVCQALFWAVYGFSLF